MSIDAKLYVSHRFNVHDIRTIIERTQQTEVTVKSNHEIAPGYFNLMFGKRMMHVHTDMHLPTGPAMMLSLHSDAEGIAILTAIADALGGILMPEDSSGNCQIINGSLWDENGLAYFLKYAVIHNGINSHDLQGIVNTMRKWYQDIPNAGKMPEVH